LLPLLIALLIPAAALGHKPSDSYLTLSVEGAQIAGQWDIALRDLDFALDLDSDGDGRITWGELRARSAAIDRYALTSLSLSADGAPCEIRARAQQVDRHSDGAYAVLHFVSDCPRVPTELTLGYGLFAGLDPQHRGLLRLERAGVTTSAVLGGSEGEQRFALGAPARGHTLLEYARQGVWHIWIGFDHILFLLSLLLPAVLRREAGRWAPAASLRGAAVEVARVVTAFTAAHSLTLSLAALGLVSLPARWVESAIAASVVLAALNNLYPLVEGRRWAVAFGFGLLHGFGFASVLGDLGLPAAALVTSLFGFNLGVELGQLAIVAAFLPAAFALRSSWAYRRLAFGFGSVAIAGVALFWLIERSFGITL
jgi:hypothetical protein